MLNQSLGFLCFNFDLHFESNFTNCGFDMMLYYVFCSAHGGECLGRLKTGAVQGIFAGRGQGIEKDMNFDRRWIVMQITKQKTVPEKSLI